MHVTGGGAYTPSTYVASATDTSVILGALAGHTEVTFNAIMVATGYNAHQNWTVSLYIGGKTSGGANFLSSATFVPADSSGIYGGTKRVNSNQATLAFDYGTIASGDLTAGTAQSVYFQIRTNPEGGLDTSVSGVKDLAIDNFRIVPEPASLGLLGLGGIMLMRRRRAGA